MITLRTHYFINGKPRCGSPRTNATTDPTRVTCKSCKKLMAKEVK